MKLLSLEMPEYLKELQKLFTGKAKFFTNRTYEVEKRLQIKANSTVPGNYETTKISAKGSGCSTVVEHPPYDKEVRFES